MRNFLLVAAISFTLLSSCSNADRSLTNTNADSTYAPAAKPENTYTTNLPPSKMPGYNTKLDEKSIHTADFKCKVKSVFDAVRQLELLTRNAGGIIEQSNLSSPVTSVKSVEKGDSITEFSSYTTTADLILRVPYFAFDSVIRSIPAMADLIELRDIKETDVTLQFLSNQLREEASAQRLKTLQQTASTDRSHAQTEQNIDRNTSNIIDRKIENLAIEKDVRYATIKVQLTQPEQIYTHTSFNNTKLSRTSFGRACIDAASESFSILGDIIVGLIAIWPFLAVAFAAIYAVKIIRRKRRFRSHTGMAA